MEVTVRLGGVAVVVVSIDEESCECADEHFSVARCKRANAFLGFERIA